MHSTCVEVTSTSRSKLGAPKVGELRLWLPPLILTLTKLMLKEDDPLKHGAKALLSFVLNLP